MEEIIEHIRIKLVEAQDEYLLAASDYNLSVQSMLDTEHIELENRMRYWGQKFNEYNTQLQILEQRINTLEVYE
ncbi:hypothetical protein D3C87_1177320 [compost metagenome]